MVKNLDTLIYVSFFIKDVLKRENIELRHCPTECMIADYFTKPLQGSPFRNMRDIIMGVTSFSVEERVEIRDEKSTEKNMRQTSSDKRNNFVAMVISVRPTTTVTKKRIQDNDHE